jgi:subtilisin
MKGFVWCIQNRCDIINCSFGSDLRPPEEMITLLANNISTIVVAAAGNESSSILNLPAGLPTSIAVGSCDPDGKVSAFSNFGNRITVVAPGRNVYSAWLDGAYRVESGTSMATAMVSGILALLLEGHRREFDPDTPLIGYQSAIEHVKNLCGGSQILDMNWEESF